MQDSNHFTDHKEVPLRSGLPSTGPDSPGTTTLRGLPAVHHQDLSRNEI